MQVVMMGAYMGAFLIFAYFFVNKNKWLFLLSTPIIAPSQLPQTSVFIHKYPDL